MLKPRFTKLASYLALLFGWSLSPLLGATNQVQEGEMAGYLIVPNEKVPKS
jgi:hypothetical protein